LTPPASERIAPGVRASLAAEIAAAGGREVSFVADVDRDGVIAGARVLARGAVDMVLACPGAMERGQMMLHNHPSGRLDPSGADLSIAARLHDAGIGFGIINNGVTELYVVVEVPRDRVVVPIDPFEIIDTLGEGGPVSAVMGQYEDRRCQRDMAAYIADGYNDGGVLLLEAGTGVGKSFAYLVPALAWARANGERTIVSTNTINLQEQLVGKDLPLLRRALEDGDYKPTFALLKGWRNYLCLSRMHQAVSAQRTLLEQEKLDELIGIAEWSSHTADGTLSDLPVTPSPEVWDEVSAEPDLCSRLKCPHFDRCFLFRARRRAAEADVVVVNHHLLAADLSVRQAADNWEEAAVLPPYRRLVLDEAHHLEDVAAGHLGVQVSSRAVRRLLGRFERNGRGLVPTLSQELMGRSDLLSRASFDLLHQRLLPALADARRASDALFLRLHERLGDSPGAQLRLADDFGSDPIWGEGLGFELDASLTAFRALRETVETIADRLDQSEETERSGQILQELRGAMRRLESLSDGLNRTLRPAGGGAPTVRWIERSQRGQHVSLSAVPLDLAPVLRELLFDRLKTVVLTSATLAVGGDFGFRRAVWAWAATSRRSRCARRSRRLSTSRRNASSACRAISPSPAARSTRTGRPWCRSSPISPMRPTGECSCCSPAMRPCGEPRPSCAPFWAPAGPSWCRVRRRGTGSCAASARPRTPSCWAPIPSGREWTCRAARSAPSSSTSYLSRFPRSP
jgi:ATP-dependent DNA helicase DinG